MQIILSTNEDPTYLEFWPIVSWAYKKIFPEAKVHLAFLTNRAEDSEFVKDMRKYGTVSTFPILPDIPEFGQAKMIRFILASQQESEVCYIDDADLMPLSRNFIIDAISRRPDNVLLCVGAECYGWEGTCPVSQMTAEGNVWKQLINPKGLSYSDLIHSWTGYFYDIREKINIDQELTEQGFKDDRYFSDERLIRRLLRENPVPIINIPRGYTDYLESTIDRATVNKKTGEWVYDLEKLKNHGYLNCHGARPYSKYEKYYLPMIEYIEDNYGK